ncbi:MAG: FliO/MopB family protein [Archangium sp.]
MFRPVLLSIALLAAPAIAQEPSLQPPPALNQPADALPVDDGARLAEPEIPKSEPPELVGQELDLGWTLFRTMMVLGMVVALAWLTLNVGLRRLMGIKPAVGSSVVTVLQRVPLDQKRALFVIEAAGEVLLVGGGEGSLSLITKLDRAELDKQRAAQPVSTVQLSPFLQKLLGRKEAPPPPPPAS